MNNTIILEASVNGFKEENELSHLKDSDVFELFSLQQILKDLDLSYADIEDSIVDGGLDGGIDSIAILVNEQYIYTEEDISEINFNSTTKTEIFITQAKYSPSFTEPVLDKLIASMPTILNLEANQTELLTRFNPTLVEKILIFRSAWTSTIIKSGVLEITYIYATKANLMESNGAFEAKIEQLIDLTRTAMNLESVSMALCSAKEILGYLQKTKIDTLELKFKENPTPVTFMDQEGGYIGVVSLQNYYRFITNDEDKINESIFESNVRHFQGNVDVNRKISNSIVNDLVTDFWWLNNGITIIASKSITVSKTLHLSDVQIVNGLQTSFLLGDNYNISNTDDTRSVLVKVIITDNKETIDKIISASNSQTAVSASVLRATDTIQRNLELFYTSKGYWYDRRKNYYKNMGKPATKIFSIQGTAQCVEAILFFNPSTARSSPTSLVKNQITYTRIFDESKDYQSYLNCCLLNKLVCDHIKSTLTPEQKNVARNFAYHLGRILACIVTEKHNYTHDDIAAIDLSVVDTEMIERAHIILRNIIIEYTNSNPPQNIINVAKSGKFSESITSHLAT